MTPVRFACLLASCAALAACGSIEPLEPAAGEPLPVRPAMARATPTPEELLTPPPYAKPERVDELMKRSQPRRPDPFDLPPPDGGAVPPPAPGAEDLPSSETVGPATPDDG